ncbi:hypothetical protein TRVA0_018S02058 [Trichomonascus vanleenenianus]|uniref:uncharacterized protein n=1 Tax=Trichomonascus vanleenenianus TaxID=2268995 RepID=UPI003ECB9223
MEARQAYRQLVRYGLKAVRYKAAEKHAYLGLLRRRFRGNIEPVDPTALNNTVTIVRNAAIHGGMELQLLRNIVHVEWGRYALRRKIYNESSDRVYSKYQRTIDALNRSMNLCI